MLSKQSVSYASFIIIISTMLSRILGFIRELLVARQFGAAVEYDHFLLALTIPLLITNVFLYAIPASYIPAFFNFQTKHGQTSADLKSIKFINNFSIVLILITLLAVLFSRSIIQYYSPSLEIGELDQIVHEFRILSVLIFLSGLFASLKSIYHSKKHFFLPAIAPLFLNLCIIAMLYLFGAKLGTKSLVAGFICGYFVQGMFLFAFLNRLNLKFRFVFKLNDSFTKIIVSAMIFILFIETLGQFYVFIDRAFMNQLPEGAISSLNYANTIFQIPIGIIGIAIGTAMFPSMSEMKSNQSYSELNILLTKGFRSIALFILPIAFIFCFFPGPIIELFYQRGAFDVNDTIQTSIALKGYSFGIIGFVFHAILVRTYYVLGYKRLLLISTIIAVVVKLLLSVFMISKYSHLSLAFSTTIASFINSGILMFYLWIKKFITLKPILISIGKFTLISAFCTGLSLWIYQILFEKYHTLILLPAILLFFIVIYFLLILGSDYNKYRLSISRIFN